MQKDEFMTKTVQILLIILGLSINCFGQIKIDSVPLNQLPESLSYKGNFIKCVKWNDKLGLNYLIISESQIVRSKIAQELIKTTEIDYISRSGDTLYDDIRTELRDKEIWGVNYVVENDSIYKLWEIYDFIKECYGGLKLDFLEPPIVTNIDNSEVYQTWLIYKLNCSSDVRPSSLKILMHVGERKYAVRGTTIISLQGKLQSDKSEKKFDKDFKALPKVILDFANELWDKHKIDNY